MSNEIAPRKTRAGVPNKKTQRLIELSEKYGVDPIECQWIVMKDLMKTVSNEIDRPRSRRSKQYLEAETKLCEVAKEISPYVYSKRAAITTEDTTPRLTVIRGPEKVSGTKDWLAIYGPKHDDAINDRPEQPIIQNLRLALDASDTLGITDPGDVIEAARRVTDADESELDKLRKGSKW
jgi:hypothetical protein